MAEDGKHQTLGAPQPEPLPELMFVLVVLKKQETEQDRFFILEWKELQNLLIRHYEAHLSKQNFVRPRKADSYHTVLPISDVEPFEDKWPKILDRVPSTLTA